ncbi:DMT family transporter [Trebonia kvetii]|uniref:DMT family transporter n=1 Tax=Trebonia kvetii TaxID=2480626 RepID=A0A6P2BSH7_9ACTN|nr:DMT family transporter [Trebonia kvetii]
MLFAAMCVIWGIPYLLIRVAVRDVAPGTLVFLRTVVGGLVLVPFALRSGGYGPVLRRWKPLVAFAAIEIAIPWLLLGDAEQHLPSALTGLLVAAVPLVGVVAGRIAGTGDHVDGRRWAGLLLGLLGVGLLVGLDIGSLSAIALVEVGLVAVGYATAPIIMAKTLSDLPSIPVVSAALLLSALAWAPYGLTHWPSHVAASGVVSIAVLGLVCTALAFVLFFALISEIGPARATVITYVNPAVAVALGLLLLNERFTAGMGIGFPLILIGSVLAASSSRIRIGRAKPADSAEAGEHLRVVTRGHLGGQQPFQAGPHDPLAEGVTAADR